MQQGADLRIVVRSHLPSSTPAEITLPFCAYKDNTYSTRFCACENHMLEARNFTLVESRYST